LIVSFGAIQEHKRPEPLLRAFAQTLQQIESGQDKPQLVLAGALRTENLDVEALISELGIGDWVTITGWLEEGDALSWMQAADFCVHLRGPSSLGTSGGAARALGVGRALVLSDLPEWAEFPGDAVRRVTIGSGEVEQLGTVLLELCRNPQQLTSMEEAAHRWAKTLAAWPIVADRMVELLGHMPGHRTARKSVLRTMNEATVRANAAKDSAGG
jgi:glycosyltransferase involved in cell wall biosynthesis